MFSTEKLCKMNAPSDLENAVQHLKDIFGLTFDDETLRVVYMQNNCDRAQSIQHLMLLNQQESDEEDNAPIAPPLALLIDGRTSVNNEPTLPWMNEVNNEVASPRLDANNGAATHNSSGASPRIPTVSKLKESFSHLSISPPKTPNVTTPNLQKAPNNIERIINYINEGYRLIILMRGLPGSGKTYLAKSIVERTVDGHYQTYVCSTDDYFMSGKRYEYNSYNLGAAHEWNQNRVRDMMRSGLSPVIVDNTNLEMWEMKPYASFACEYGYRIEIVEPCNSWSKSVRELAQRNVHRVPAAKIKSMLERWENNVTVERLLRAFNFAYARDSVPPQLRNIPVVFSKPAVEWSEEPWVEPAIEERNPNPKPQRARRENNDCLLNNFNPDTDWKTIEMQWNSYSLCDPNLKTDETVLKPKMRDSSMNTNSTAVLLPGDRVVANQSRDINAGNHAPIPSNKPPLILKLDKGSATDDILETIQIGEETVDDFATLRNMFTHINEVYLREIYDKCKGDINWAVDLLLDVETNGITAPTVTNDIIDVPIANEINNAPLPESPAPKYKKKDKIISESTMQLKRQLEQNISIPDSFYSDHYLKLRKIRRGELSSPEPSTSDPPLTLDELQDVALTEDAETQEDTMMIHVGTQFIQQLDAIFESEVEYPDTIRPIINIPKSLLNQMYALWMESLSHQVVMQSQIAEDMQNEDLEFARALADKEKEQLAQGLPPKVPNLEEIMSMELALDLSNANSRQRNEREDDYAMRLSKQKLIELFPGVDKNMLFEILAAHENKFQQTVQVVMMSTGMTDGEEDASVAVNRLISQHDLETKQAKLLEKAQHEIQKDITNGEEEALDASQVDIYREKARKHLDIRNRYHSQAKEFFQKGMYSAATYYSQIAALHKKNFDHANSLAANCLIQTHSMRADSHTLDLHYLYVAEALEALDMFLDKNIAELAAVVSEGPYTIMQRSLFLITGRGLHSRGGPRVKPAVRKRLKQRGVKYTHVNPGLLSVTVDNADKLTDQL